MVRCKRQTLGFSPGMAGRHGGEVESGLKMADLILEALDHRKWISNAFRDIALVILSYAC